MRWLSLGGSMIAFLALVLIAPEAEMTLIKKNDDGGFKPGLAKSWSTRRDSVTFLIDAKNVDGSKLVRSVSEHVAGVRASFDGKHLTVAGLPAPTLLDRMAETHVDLGEAAVGNGLLSRRDPE